MAASGIRIIDELFSNGGGTPIVTGTQDREAVGVIQDFLAGLGVPGMPGPTSPSRGLFGPATTAAVRAFQQRSGLPQIPPADATRATVDGATLRALAQAPAVSPTACCGYLSLVLDFPYTGMLRVMSLTTLFEGAGKFSAQNRNTDRAGLSFGLIQWAQSPGRLNELLRAFRTAQPDLFVSIFGAGDARVADGLLAHTAQTRGGTDAQGVTTDRRYDLIAEPWTSRFREAALNRDLQCVQVATALRAFNHSFERMRTYAPQIRSERGVAFFLDLANQHGDGGARSIYTTVAGTNPTETQLLQAMEEESVRRVGAQFGAGSKEVQSTRHRRTEFRTTPLLSDAPFQAS